jgi:rhodanese-related sulfurtransferase
MFVLAALTLVVAAGAFAQNGEHSSSREKGADETAKHQMTARDLKQRIDKGEKVIVIDARHSLNGQMLKGAIHVPTDKLNEWAKDAEKTAVIVTYCTCPHDEAAEAEVRSLLAMGFKNAFSLKGGLDAARGAGIDIVKPAE